MNQSAISSLGYDVAVVGLGPVGATLANILGQAGVRVVVLEREAAAYHLPRAVHFDDEVMRLFQSIGLAETLLPYLALSTGMRFLDPAGRIILDWSRLHPIKPHGWNASYRFHQPELEDVLRRGLTRWPSVTVRTRCEAFAVEQQANGVVVRFEDLGSGRLYAVNARYVVGCDGARSLIRRLIGSGLVDLGFHERWLVIDAILKRPRPDLGDISLQFCDPERPATYVRGVGDRRRWEITLKDDEPTAQMSDGARVWSLLQRWITPDDAELERSAVYTFHSVIAERWRSGRLLIAGDAAHQTPPFLGQGMCAGMRESPISAGSWLGYCAANSPTICWTVTRPSAFRMFASTSNSRSSSAASSTPGQPTSPCQIPRRRPATRCSSGWTSRGSAAHFIGAKAISSAG